jgi:hypothetical protein
VHDVLAELQGYRNELAQAQQRGDSETAAAVQAEIERVSSTARSIAAAHADEAARHHDAGAHALAAQARAHAARYSDAAGPGWEDTADHTELETAVTPKRARPRKDTV